MRKLLWIALAAAAALLVARVALARCLDEDCGPPTAPPATAAWLPLWTPTPAPVVLFELVPAEISPTPDASAPPMSTDMPARPAGCETPPPWADLETAERCYPFWAAPLSAPIPYCRTGYTLQMDLVCWGYVPSDPGWFPTPPPGGWPTATPALPVTATAPPGYP